MSDKKSILALMNSLLEKMPERLHEQVRSLVQRALNSESASSERDKYFESLTVMNQLDWSDNPPPNPSLKKATAILNSSHAGMKDVKDIILEYIAVLKLRKDKTKTPILLFVGPPGVGKSSVAESIAAALQRPLIRIFLGGVEEPGHIRGDKKKFVAAGPGRIIQGLAAAKTRHSVILLDEIDKTEEKINSALLQVMDYSQNSEFVDHFLEIPYSLTDCLFIATANTTSTINPALLDRMEVVELSSYTEEEKIKIVKEYLLPKIKKDIGLHDKYFSLEHKSLLLLIRQYSNEAGVRNISKLLNQIARKIARQVVEKKRKMKNHFITPHQVKKMLGPPIYLERGDEPLPPGSVNGLTVDSAGGHVTVVEAILVPRNSNSRPTVYSTGELYTMTSESLQVVLSLFKARAEAMGVSNLNKLLEMDLHIHYPDGVGTGIDGPSAGVTMFTCLYTLLTGKSISPDLAMTGAVNLRGQVLEIGGLKEKILGAYRRGKHKIIIPLENQKDLVKIPGEVLAEMEIVPVSTVEELIEACDFYEEDSSR